MPKRLTKIEVLKRFEEKHGNRYDYSLFGDFINTRQKIDIICEEHGIFTMKIISHYYGDGDNCPKCCDNFPMTTEEFNRRSELIHGDRYDYSESICNGTRNSIKIKCRIHGFFETLVQSHLNGHNCKECSDDDRRFDFNHEAMKIHGDRYSYDKVDYKNIDSDIIINCEEHGDFTQRAGLHLSGSGCNECSVIERTDTNEDFINKSKIIHGKDKFLYQNTQYTKSKEIVIITCKIHGDFDIMPYNHLGSKQGCSKCAPKSKGESLIKYFFDNETNLIYETEKKFDDCRNINTLPFDFYLPEYNTCIEFDGLQHYEPRFGKNEFDNIILRDNIKNQYCLDNDIKLIRIPYWDIKNIKDILIKELNLTL